MAEESRGLRFLMGIAVTLMLAIVGLGLYRAYTGAGTISQVFAIALLAIIVFFLIKLGVFSKDRDWSLDKIFTLVLGIGIPLFILIKFPTLTSGLFTTIGFQGNAGGTVTLEGGLVDWARANTLFFIAIMVGLYFLDKKIVKFIREVKS